MKFIGKGVIFINNLKAKRCIRCLAVEARSKGTLIGDDGVCNHCKINPSRYNRMSWEEKEQKFLELIHAAKGKHRYDGFIMMSGGKDSTYLALKLKNEYKLNLMAMSVDNGFEYPDSFDNARKVCDKLGIPYIILQPDMRQLRKFYRYIITEKHLRHDDYSQICLYCGNYLKRQVDIYAEKFDAAYIFSGYNPDQVTELGEAAIVEADPGLAQYQQMIKRTLDEKMQDAYQYTLQKNDPELAACFELPRTKILYYYQHFPYDPIHMLATIRQELDWEPIKRFSKNYLVSGCQLVCTLVHLCQQKNIPDYIQKEFSAQIRRGTLTKEQVEKVMAEIKFSNEEIDETLAKLDLTCAQMLTL
ncbi:conserved hypothetical protein [uncultured Sporomusa sp.]|uniref:N-acetyl sugar amidotransferase n=1 Tax=uncultured Sporomusa sp. TaxID=307249 RepID=A0A212LV90_9FIRM|nr:hypothetical protein [uncultured Sporomusa sp.]SCM81453.1 conserved hypothetical protein [uncultured Sporomusa sp.]